MSTDKMTIKNPDFPFTCYKVEQTIYHSEVIVGLYFDSTFVAPQHHNDLSEHTFQKQSRE